MGFCPQASEGVPMRFFTKLDQLIDFYKKENMGLVTHLQYPVPLEEEDTTDDPEEDTGKRERRGCCEARRCLPKPAFHTPQHLWIRVL
jgi:hypothetical protein